MCQASNAMTIILLCVLFYLNVGIITDLLLFLQLLTSNDSQRQSHYINVLPFHLCHLSYATPYFNHYSCLNYYSYLLNGYLPEWQHRHPQDIPTEMTEWQSNPSTLHIWPHLPAPTQALSSLLGACVPSRSRKGAREGMVTAILDTQVPWNNFAHSASYQLPWTSKQSFTTSSRSLPWRPLLPPRLSPAPSFDAHLALPRLHGPSLLFDPTLWDPQDKTESEPCLPSAWQGWAQPCFLLWLFHWIMLYKIVRVIGHSLFYFCHSFEIL